MYEEYDDRTWYDDDREFHKFYIRTSLPDIMGAVARAWCHNQNSHKIMDGDLAEAAGQEIWKLLKELNVRKVTANG